MNIEYLETQELLQRHANPKMRLKPFYESNLQKEGA